MNGFSEIIDYDLERHDFPQFVRNALKRDDLSGLRGDLSPPEGWSIYKAMEDTDLYRAFWAMVGQPDFLKLYRTFIRDAVRPLFAEPIRVQAIPTPRILFADQRGASRFHRDREYGHDPRETNFFLPLTPCFSGNAMWVESKDGAADYEPAELLPGQLLKFDGANLAHGAMENDTGRSRVSLDFRAITETDAMLSHRRIMSAADKRSPHFFELYD